MNLTATLLLNQQAELEAKLENVYAVIAKARRGEMGLTLDEDKTPEWRKAKSDHAFYFSQLRMVNSKLNKERIFLRYDVKDGKRVSVYKYKK